MHSSLPAWNLEHTSTLQNCHRSYSDLTTVYFRVLLCLFCSCKLPSFSPPLLASATLSNCCSAWATSWCTGRAMANVSCASFDKPIMAQWYPPSVIVQTSFQRQHWVMSHATLQPLIAALQQQIDVPAWTGKHMLCNSSETNHSTIAACTSCNVKCVVSIVTVGQTVANRWTVCMTLQVWAHSQRNRQCIMYSLL